MMMMMMMIELICQLHAFKKANCIPMKKTVFCRAIATINLTTAIKENNSV